MYQGMLLIVMFDVIEKVANISLTVLWDFSRTINFAVFVDLQLPRKLILENLIIVYKCNDSLVDP